MSLQDRPICWGCDLVIESDWVFAAPCDHHDHSSAVWHGLCLMEWRANREARAKAFARWVSEHRGQWVPGLIQLPPAGDAPSS